MTEKGWFEKKNVKEVYAKELDRLIREKLDLGESKIDAESGHAIRRGG